MAGEFINREEEEEEEKGEEEEEEEEKAIAILWLSGGAYGYEYADTHMVWRDRAIKGQLFLLGFSAAADLLLNVVGPYSSFFFIEKLINARSISTASYIM